MGDIFEAIDKSGRKIHLRDEGWKHIGREHPDVTNIDEIKDALTDPVKICPSKYDPTSVRWYYKYNKEKRKFFFVAVKYLNGEGFVITSYYVRGMP